MVNRKIYSSLKDFFLNDKKSLLVTGARQVGKTYAIRKVGEETFKHFVEFNFIKNPKLKTIFANPLDTNDILLRISALTDTKLEPSSTFTISTAKNRENSISSLNTTIRLSR